MSGFEGDVAVVTGAGGGIGRGICSELAVRGATIAAVDIDTDRGQTSLDTVRSAGGRGSFYAADIADPEAIARLMDQIAAEHGSIDVLVNGAGVSVRSTFADITPVSWDAMSNTNLRGLFFTIQGVVPHMERAGGGRIVSISSISAKGHRTANAAYAATKGGVISLTRIAAAQLGSLNINVNCVCPGMVMTDMFESYLTARSETDRQSREEILAELLSETALGKISTVSDVANAVAFLASEEARTITGQSLNVDAGMVWD
jgi:NAD(P)-dependent dehydrogenase (short-subunit alcohol dehydrogenase family)